MKELEQDLKKIFLAGIGALAVTAEKSEELLKELVHKGELTVEQGKALNEELRHRKSAPAPAQPNVEGMSREERAALKRRLEELEAKEQDGKAD